MVVRPPKLRKGDLIGIVSPASPIADPARIERGVRYLESLGYRTTVGAHAGSIDGYLAGKDRDRAADIHAMFSNKRVKAVFCVRGGYGTTRLLELLDYGLISRNPKILAGFSDITALQLALWKKCRLITFHGPMVGVEMANQIDPFTEEQFWECITSEGTRGKIVRFNGRSIETPVKGECAGRLLGGNLSLIVSLLGTGYQPEFRNSILFIEEIAEEPYRVDRMMTQLRNAGVFTKASGLLLGQFTDCVPSDPSRPSQTTQAVLHEAAILFGKPVFSNLPFGHVPQKMTLPAGLRIRMDGRKQTLEFLEAPVR